MEALQGWSCDNGNANVSALTNDVIKAHLDDTRAGSTSLVYGKVCAILMLFLRHLAAENIIPQIPLSIARPRRLRAEIRTFTQSEMLRLRDVVIRESGRDFAIFMLLADTGIRAPELCGLTIADFRWDRIEVVIRPQIAKNRFARAGDSSERFTPSVAALPQGSRRRHDRKRCVLSLVLRDADLRWRIDAC